MINASKAFKEKMKNGGKVVNYADITLSDGTELHLTPADFMIGGCAIEDKTTDGKFGIGFVIGKTISIRIANHNERFSSYDFYKSIIYLYVALALDDGTVEKIRKGVYYATVPETPGDVIEINGVDAMCLLDRAYTESDTSYPATVQTIITDACLDCGIPIGFGKFDNYGFVVKEKPEGVTYRQVVSFAAQIAGYNVRINNDGYMELVWYDKDLLARHVYQGGSFANYQNNTVICGGTFEDYTADTIISSGTFVDKAPISIGRYKSLDVHTDDVVITGVQVIGEETEVFFGEAGYVVKIESNPMVNGKEQEIADYLGERLVGIYFRPFTIQMPGNPLYEPLDVCKVTDRKGNVYQSIINSVSYTIGSFTQIACEAEDPLRNGSSYYSPAVTAVVEARRNTKKQLSTYDKAVQNMSQLAGNAMGYHTTYEEQEDGSKIIYLHDKPNLSESTIIYKQTIDGFFVSQDGGENYTLGFDSNGNAVVNILYAIGIVADWIKGGTLTLGGDNNIDGSCVIYDASGNEIGRFDKDGIVTNSAKITGGYINIVTNNEEESSIILNGTIQDIEYMLMLFPHRITINGGEFSTSMGSGSIAVSSSKFTCNFSWNGVLFNSSNYYNQNTLKIQNTEISSGKVIINYGSGEAVSLGQTLSQIHGWTFRDGNLQSDNESYMFTSNGCWIDENFYVGSSGNVKMAFWTDGSVSFYGYNQILASNMDIHAKNLYLSGTKSRMASTQNYSERLLYCYEMPKPYFGDIGEASLDENGLCYVFIDDIFFETINTNCQYQVFLQKYGQGDVWIKERSNNYFVVEGTPKLTFGWELKARQAGYEMERLEKIKEKETEENVDYEQEAQKYINSYYKEMIEV